MNYKRKDIEVHPIEIRGGEYKVFVTSSGAFWSEVDDDHTIQAETREALYDKMMEATRRKSAKVAIPVYQRSGGKVGRIVFTGIHGGTKKLLYRDEHNQRAQTGHFGGIYVADDTDIGTYERLIDIAAKANRELEAFEAEHKVEPRKMIEAALAAQE